MPSITPGYLYTFIALLAVSSLLVFSFMAYTGVLRFSSEVKLLKNLMDNIAARSTQLLTLALATNSSSETYIQMPVAIGNMQYWIQIRNSSAKSWLEGGFGDTLIEQTDMRVYLPSEVSASGHYVGGYGAAHLECSFEDDVVRIFLESTS